MVSFEKEFGLSLFFRKCEWVVRKMSGLIGFVVKKSSWEFYVTTKSALDTAQFAVRDKQSTNVSTSKKNRLINTCLLQDETEETQKNEYFDQKRQE